MKKNYQNPSVDVTASVASMEIICGSYKNLSGGGNVGGGGLGPGGGSMGGLSVPGRKVYQ